MELQSDTGFGAMTARFDEHLGDVLQRLRQPGAAREAYGSLVCLPAGARVAKGRLYRKPGETWMAERHFDEALQAYTSANAALGDAAQVRRQGLDLGAKTDANLVAHRLIAVTTSDSARTGCGLSRST